MTKQEKIQQAYGEHWDLVKDIVSSGNGWTKPIGYTAKDKEFYVNLLKISKKEGWDNDQGLFRPKSLHGIVTNNGWNKINSESDLPEFESTYLVMDKSQGGTMIEYHFIKNNVGKSYWMRNFTHWMPKLETQKPLY